MRSEVFGLDLPSTLANTLLLSTMLPRVTPTDVDAAADDDDCVDAVVVVDDAADADAIGAGDDDNGVDDVELDLLSGNNFSIVAVYMIRINCSQNRVYKRTTQQQTDLFTGGA